MSDDGEVVVGTGVDGVEPACWELELVGDQGDSHLLQLAGDDARRGGGVGQSGHPHPQGEAIAVASLLEQTPGLVRVVGQLARQVLVPRVGRRDHGADERPLPVRHGLHEVLPIDGMHYRTANALVGQRLGLIVHPHDDLIVRRAGDDVVAGRILEPAQCLWGGEIGEDVDVTTHEGSGLGGGIGEVQELHVRHPGFQVPRLWGGGEIDRVSGPKIRDDVGPRSRRMGGKVGLDGGVDDDAGGTSQVEQQEIVRVAQVEHDGVGILDAHRLDGTELGLGDGNTVPTIVVQGRGNCLGVHWCPRGESGRRIKVKGVGETVGTLLPRPCQQWCEVAIVVDLRQCLIDVVEQYLGDRRSGILCDVQCRWSCSGCNDHRFVSRFIAGGMWGATCCRHCQAQGEEEPHHP